MRLFAGIFPPQEVLEQLSEVAVQVKEMHPNAIIVKPEKMHLTVRFFGQAELEETLGCMEAAARRAEKFMVTLNHVDAFPNRKMARVVFCGVSDPTPIESLMHAAGQLKPRAHLTVARLATPRTIKKAEIEPIVFQAESVRLVNSVLGKDARYEIMKEWALG